MAQNSFPKAAVLDEGLDDHHWKNLMLPMGRGIIDKGGFPYRLTARDSITNTVTIGVDSREGENFAILDGFLHHMDAPEQVPVPPVTVDTVYEIGLVYDPQAHAAEKGPVTLRAWTAPADTSQNRSYLVLYRMTRKPNLALGSTPYEEERPRVTPRFSVSKESSLPKHSLVLVDSQGVVRTTGEEFRAEIAESGEIKWIPIGGGGDLESATSAATPGTIVKRGHDGSFLVGESDAMYSPTTKRYVDARASWSGLPGKPSSFNPSSHTHEGSEIQSRIPFEHVDGSLAAWQNSNLGSTWTSVAVNDKGFLGRYPSALKTKKNIRPWNISGATAVSVQPIKYEDKEAGDTRVGVPADSYVDTIPELVEFDPVTGEVMGWKYMLMPVLQQVAIRWHEDRIKALETENARLKFNQNEILAFLGLGTDADGRVIIEGETAPDNGSEA